MNRYWWGTGRDRGIHWKAWDKLCIPKKYGGLRFKDLRAFNLAMLGKQAWRFLTNTDSLVARVYKARYYPNNDFTEASLGGNPSYCWRSVMTAKQLVCNGVRRRIGSGASTLIWEHPWLQDDTDQMIHTEMPPQLAGAKVVGLIDQETGQWDQQIVVDIFEPDDVPRILKIPISPDYEDTWYWHGDPNGNYSVKDGYKLIVGNYDTLANVSYDKWLKLWGLKIPPKWKIFLWRSLNGIFPTMDNLLLKRVEVEPVCNMCGMDHEDIMHSLVSCDYAKAIWAQSNLPIPNIITNIFHEWFSALLNVLDSDGIMFTATILYHLWRARNGAVWDACLQRPTRVLATAMSTLSAWTRVHSPPALPHSAEQQMPPAESLATPQQPVVPRHGPPPTAEATQTTHQLQPLQCYIDAGYKHRTNAATAGAILFTASGDYLAAFCAPLTACFSPLMAEAMACKEVLAWLRDRGDQRVRIFTDCHALQ
ncbi:PREDICTED: uncharacterized protein LOC109175143 [Ipomoea nil]|uniref:uncharacterized protein LOC109175143 n=1 Tax=Ipomoea nil TaxID=35883 RepID=UPI0009013F23|nr:PREDICTED: uncharacterized protein LOC109175143 [Ipomoea nil]